MFNSPALRYAFIGTILLIVVGLGGWYVFIRGKQADIESSDASRGVGLTAPSFVSQVGSTYENIVSTLAGAFTGDRGNTSSADEAQLVQVSKSPTAGAGFVGRATSTRLRFVERGSGYVFNYNLETGALERLTNTLVPKTYRASIAINGNMLMQGEEEGGEVIMARARLSTTTVPGETFFTLTRTFFAGNVTAAALRPEGDEVFYISRTESGGKGVRALWSGDNEKEIVSSMVSGWDATWLPSDRIILVQKPSDGTVGYAYEVGNGGGLILLARAEGMTFLPHPASKAYIYGASSKELTLSVRAGTTSTDVLLPLKTIADKCVWHPKDAVAYCAVPQTSPPPNFLDAYHRGEIHTSDAWWRVDGNAGTVELLLPPGDTAIDVEDPVIDASGSAITFINSADKSLWYLRISND